MTLPLRPITPDEFSAFHQATELGFGGPVRVEERELEATVFEPARSLAAFDGGRIAGTAGAFTFTMSVPGGEAPVAGVTWVAVTPTHRRQGLLSAMMRRQLGDIHDEGREAVAALFASEGAIYPRFGYGLAALGAAVSLDTRRGSFHPRPPWPGRVVLLAPEEARPTIAPAYDAARRLRPGWVARTDAWWGKRLADLDHWRGEGSPLRVAAYVSDSGCGGYATYRTRPSWQDTGPEGTVEVREIVVADADAEAALWRYLLDLDLMRTVTASHLPPDSALLHLLAEPRAARMRLSDNLWVRLVDVPVALAQRRYAVPGAVVLEVTDAVCDWNTGRYLLDATGAVAGCERTDRAPDLELSVTELGAAFLGGTRLGSLAAAGRVVEHVPGALARADAMFAWSPLPACPEVF